MSNTSEKTPYLFVFEHHHKNQSLFRCRCQNQVLFDPQTRNKSIPIPKLKPTQPCPRHWREVNIDHPGKNQVSFDAHTITGRHSIRAHGVPKNPYILLFYTSFEVLITTYPFHITKRFAACIQNPSQFRPPPAHQTRSIDCDTSNKLISARTRSISTVRTKNRSLSSPSTENKANSIPHTKIKLFSTPIPKSCQFDPHSKIKSISMPPYKNQFDLDPHTKTNYLSTPTQTPSHVRSLHWRQVNFDSHNKIKSISMSWHQNQVNFDPYTKTKSISIPALKPSEVPSPT